MAKEIITHTDLMGQNISVGSYVVASHKNAYTSSMCICCITKLTPKKVFLKDVKKVYKEWSVWPSETVKLSGEEALFYILKHA
jgi:hypothetical protein